MSLRFAPHNALSLREQLAELLHTNLAESTRAYIAAHPHLVSDDAVGTLDEWHRQAVARQDAETAERVLWFSSLLRMVWPLCLCLPLSVPPTTKAYPELTQRLAELGIHTRFDLSQRVRATPGLRQRLVTLAIEHVSTLDWAVMVLVAASNMGSVALAWIEEHRDLLGYDAEFALNVYRHWATTEDQASLQKLLDCAHALLGHVRQEVKVGRLRLHNMPVLRFVLEYVDADSWDESISILEDHSEVLTDDGVEEMVSCLQSAFAGALLGRNPPATIARYAMHLTFLELARQRGLEEAYDALPLMPPALLLVAGMLRVVRPGVDRWEALSSWLSSQPAAVQPLAHILRLAGVSAQHLIDSEVDLQRPITSDEIARLALFALLQHMLRSPASHALALAIREAGALWNPEAAQLLEALRPGADDPVSALCDSLSILARSPYGLDMMRTLDQHPLPELDDIVTDGSSLLLLMGRFAQLADLAADDMPMDWWGDPCWDGVAAGRLLEHIIAHSSEDLAQRLRPSFPFLQETARIGSLAAVHARLNEWLNPSGIDAAVTAWGFVRDRSALEALIEQYPILLTAEADAHVREIVDLTRDSGDPAALAHTQERYAWLVAIRRAHLEAQAGLVVPLQTSGAPDPILKLIGDLEVAIPLGAWLPVSRIDLSDAFFDRLHRHIGELESRLGAECASSLHLVAENASRWRAQFGAVDSDHTAAVATFLTDLLHVSDDARMHDIIAENEAIAESQAAADILGDWLVVAEDLSATDVVDRLRDRSVLLDAVRRSSIDFAFLARSGGASPESVALLSQALGLGHCEDIVAVVEAARDAPLDTLIAAGQHAEDLLRRQGRDDLEALAADMRLRTLALRLQDAFASGPEAYTRFLMSEPLLMDPSATCAVESILQQQPPALREATTWFLRYLADPVLRALLQGSLTQDQTAELAQLDAAVIALVSSPTWRQRFDLVARHEELCTERSVLWVEWRAKAVEAGTRSGAHSDAIAEAGVQLLGEIGQYLRRCLEVGQDAATAEKILALSGQHAILESRSIVRLYWHLPASQELALDTTRGERPDALAQLAASAELDAEDRATAQSLLAMYHKAQHEQYHERAALDRATEAYRRAVAMTPEGPDRAVRRRWLAACLLARFQHHGERKEDPREAIEVLRAGLQFPLINEIRTQLLGELGRALSMRGETSNTVGDVREAVAVLEEAVRASTPGSEEWVGWHLNLGAAWSALGAMTQDPEAWVRAERVYQEALAGGDPAPSLAFSLRHNLANVRRYWGEARHSLEGLDKALRTYEDLDSSDLADEERASLYFSMGTGWMSRHEITADIRCLDRAIVSLRQALELLDGSTPDAAMCRTNLAVALQRRASLSEGDDTEEAMAIYEAILSASLEDSWPHLVVTAAENYGNYCLRLGSSSQARRVYETGLSALERMRQSATTQQDVLRHSEEYAALYGRLVYSCLKTGDTAAAYRYAMCAKAYAFAHQRGGEPGSPESEDPHLATMLREAQDVQAELEGLRRALELQRDVLPPQAREAMRREVVTLQTRQAELFERTAKLSRHAPIGPSESAASPDPAQVQAVLAQTNAVALEFYCDYGGWGAFVVTSEHITHVRLSREDPPWQTWIDHLFAQDYTPRPCAEFRRVLRSLHTFFIAPVETHLPASGANLVLAPTDLMAMFPVAAALTPDERSLCDRFAITTVPSTHLFRHTTRAAFQSILGVSHPGLAGHRGYIPFADLEVKMICGVFTDAKCLTGDDATREAIGALAGRYDAVHFACHGVVNWRQPESSGLILPNGTWLTVLDFLTRVRLEGTSLVVLSACDVGLEMPRPGDEHVGLVRAVELAGAPAVVASLWAACDISTMLLMRQFYTALIEGHSIASALRSAQVWLRNAKASEVLVQLEELEADLAARGQAEMALEVFRGRLAIMSHGQQFPFSHPFYWAGFQAYGSAV